MAEPNEKQPGTVAEPSPDELTDKDADKVSGGVLGNINLNRAVEKRPGGLDEGIDDVRRPPTGPHVA